MSRQSGSKPSNIHILLIVSRTFWINLGYQKNVQTLFLKNNFFIFLFYENKKII